ncbi:uncharacterized protein LOC143188276 [Calliopsis andreniformis]|uniref:uncharacterized protein LOC143188276 n=1 Tax=Calliopsis andreniformis TaxID=337506 RepID=UPI003FCD9B04
MTFQFVLYSILIYGGSSEAKPIDPEDLESLLPPTPRDKNETIAAVVQDPVVQDAVHTAASSGSLNGLVVKKKVYIMPANDPNKILSKREHLLVVPNENLEDVRKNITEAKEAEAATEFSSPENLSLFEGNDGYAPEVQNNNSPDTFRCLRSLFTINHVEKSITTNTLLRKESNTEMKFLEDKISSDAPQPEDESKKIAVPIVAVIDPSNVKKDKVNTPIVAILPNQLNNDALKSQVQFLEDNSDKIQRKAQSFIEQTSLAVEPGYRTSSPEMAIDSSSTQGTWLAPLSPELEASRLVTEQVFLAPVVVPRWEIVAPIFPDESVVDSRNTGDMDVAEDIIFRPLFRYRQESQERSRYRESGGNRRYGYKPYRDYDYYPRRNYYRSHYEDY